MGSIVRAIPAINIFSAADNSGAFNDNYGGAPNNPIGAVGFNHDLSFYNNSGLSETSDNDIPEIYSTPLIRAASTGDQKKVAQLLSENVPVNALDSEKRTALIAAAYYGHNAVCSLLIDGGASLDPKDKDGFTALDFAASRGLVDTVKLLLSKSKKPDVRNHIEYAMTMQAAFSSIEGFLPKGKGIIPSINFISPEDKSPLHVAASGGSVDLVTNLLNRGAKVNLANRKGQTPLHSAALSNKTFIISLLLKKSAKINATDTHGNTPLMLATKKNRREAVLLLIEKGADKTLRNKKGENAANIAVNNEFAEIAAILQK